MFSRLLSQVLKYLGFPIERRPVCKVVFTVEKWQFVLGAPYLPPRDQTEDQPAANHLVDDQPPPTVPTEEPQIPASTAPLVTIPLPASFASSSPQLPPVPHI